MKRNVRVRDKNNTDLIVDTSGEVMKIENSTDFYYINYCEDFNNTFSTLSNCVYLKEDTGDYTVGTIKDIRLISLRKLKELNKSYYENYESLKANLGLASSNDFAIFVFDSEQNSIIEIKPESGIPSSLNVMSKNSNIQILDINGGWEIKSGILNIRIW